MTDNKTAMREPTKAEIARFKRAARSLASLGEIGFKLYLANDHLHLMIDDSHIGFYGDVPNRDAIRASVTIPNSGGGDW